MADPLSQIELEAAALDAGAAAAPGLNAPAGPAAVSEADQVAMWAAIPATFGAVLSMAMPELAAVYSPAACENWGKAMLPVAKKHGWNDLESLPELSLALVSLPFAIATIMAIKKRKGPAPGAVEGKGGAEGKAADAAPTIGPNAGVS